MSSFSFSNENLEFHDDDIELISRLQEVDDPDYVPNLSSQDSNNSSCSDNSQGQKVCE